MPLSPYWRPATKTPFVEFRILNSAVGVFDVFEQAGRAEHLEPAVDAAQELGRRDKPLDRIELRALDHPRRGAELAAWIKLRLDPAVAAGLDQAGKNLHPFVLGIVQRLRAQLHHDRSLRVEAAGRQSERNAGTHPAQNVSAAEFSVDPPCHCLLPPSMS